MPSKNDYKNIRKGWAVLTSRPVISLIALTIGTFNPELGQAISSVLNALGGIDF